MATSIAIQANTVPVIAMSTKSKASSGPALSAFDNTANIVWTPANFDTVDTTAAFNGTTYTIPISGWYTITAQVSVGGTEANNDGVALWLFVNAAAHSFMQLRIMNTGLTNVTPAYSGQYFFNAGDALTFRIDSTISGASISNTSSVGRHAFTIVKVG